MPPFPQPLAVAVLYLSPTMTAADRSNARVALAVKATNEGYALLETYDIDQARLQEAAVFEAVTALASRVKLRALVYASTDQRAHLRGLAMRHQLILLETV